VVCFLVRFDRSIFFKINPTIYHRLGPRSRVLIIVTSYVIYYSRTLKGHNLRPLSDPSVLYKTYSETVCNNASFITMYFPCYESRLWSVQEETKCSRYCWNKYYESVYWKDHVNGGTLIMKSAPFCLMQRTRRLKSLAPICYPLYKVTDS
jgi:hypothetical protein